MKWVVNRQAHVLEVRHEESVVAWFPIGVGRADAPTPAGHWTLSTLADAADSDKIAVLSTPSYCCLRATRDVQSLGRDVSGG